MQQRKWAMLAAGAMLTTMLTGCMGKHGELGNRNIRGNSVSYDMNGNRILNTRFANDQMNEMNRVDGHRLNSNNLVGLHKNYRMEMSETMADRIAGIKGVDKAYVMLTNDNAYVAVTLKHGAAAGAGVGAKSGTSSLSLSGPMPLSRTQQAYMRPYTMRSSNAHALNTAPKQHTTRASSIATPNMHLAGTKNTYGMNGMLGTSGNYGMNGMYGTSGTNMYGKPDGRLSSSYNNVSNGVRNMSLSSNTNSYLRYPNGMTNLSRNTARGLTNLSNNLTGTTLPHAMNKGMNALYRDTADVTRGTTNLGRDVARGTTDLGRDVSQGIRDLARGTGNLIVNTVNLPADIAKGTPSNLGRDLARDTTNVGRDVVRGTLNAGQNVARGTVDVGRNVVRGTANVTSDVARGTTRGLTGTTMPYAVNRMAADGDVTAALKAQIASEIKKMSPTIKNVYVSASPEFVDRMSAYAGDVKAGHPIQGFIAEFNAMVDRIFPARYGS